MERVLERYKLENPEEILERIVRTLEKEAPNYWRFTESITVRFFVIDFPSKVKVLGFSYRDFGKEIVAEIMDKIVKNNVQTLRMNLANFIDRYVKSLFNPDTKIVHQLRTAYPKESGEIGEEKKVFSASKEQVSHIIPLREKKMAARPNAVVLDQANLWVRQHMNWVNMKDSNKEYLLFEKLTRKGIDKSQHRIFGYSSNGHLEEIPLQGCPAGYSNRCYRAGFQSAVGRAGYRTESYWVLPTYLDLRMLDLDFRERFPDKTEEGFLNKEELVELYFLREVVEAAEKKLA